VPVAIPIAREVRADLQVPGLTPIWGGVVVAPIAPYLLPEKAGEGEDEAACADPH
jgi:hypothetical protein